MLENNLQNSIDITLKAPRRRFLKIFSVGLLVLFAVGLIFTGYINQLNRPPADFPLGQPITIEEGMNVKEITEFLQAERVVRSASNLYLNIVFKHDATAIKASTYVFDAPLTTKEVASRLTEGDFSNDLIRLTHIEGERASSLARRASTVLTDFNAESFILLAEPYEGKLYPETYFIPATYSEEDLLNLLLQNFDEAIAGLEDKITTHPLSLDQILVLASIIEREANSPESMKMVSGILQNRLEINMPLQADASIEYVLDKPLSSLTPDDLKIDSPYNTYLNTGLPPTPIGNPGPIAITAVLEPVVSDYFYYLTDDETGEFHYAETYDEHLRNINRYLR